MEITINATAYYSNGDTESFTKTTDVTVEECYLIKQCAKENNGELDELVNISGDLYYNLESLFDCEAEQASYGIGSYQPIQMIGGGGTTYRHRHVELIHITMYLKEEQQCKHQ